VPEAVNPADPIFPQMRSNARSIFQQALTGATIEQAFQRHVHCERGVLRVCEDLYDLHSYSRVFVASIGKAGHTMAQALAAQVGESIEGIVACPVEPASQLRGFRYFRGGHPTPNAESMRAGDAILKSVTALGASDLVIFLLSGGGSSIAEKPIDDDISLEDLILTYRVLVHSGAPIAQVNAVRKHLSAIKGGRLAQAAYPAWQVSLMVSDVPDATPDALASGPTMPDSATVQECYSVVEQFQMLEQFPASVRELFERHAIDETPKSDDPAFIHSRWWPILSNKSAVEHAAAAAATLGFAVELDHSCDDWDYDRAADYLLAKLRKLRESVSRVCLISGGEVTVKVTNDGVGGRNQQFALACAAKTAGENITVLSAGTDGGDGNSSAAGAVVDGTTMARAKAKGLDAASALARFDAYPLLDSLGDTIVTGPTGNNLRDIRVLLTY
jgi:hydroxypyruvate reductase